MGRSIVTSTSSNAASYAPKVYQLNKVAIGSNSLNLTVTSSYVGTLYYAIVKGGTPRGKVSHSEIYNQNLTMGIVYGTNVVDSVTTGVNI